MSAQTLPQPLFQRARRMATRLNAPLIVGALLVAMIVIGSLAAPLIAPFDPYIPKLIFNEGRMARMPYPPGAYGMPLGSDSTGRDLLSRLLYGGRFTLLFCGVASLMRVLLGALLGMLAGWYDRAARLVDVLVSAWSAIPSLIFAVVPILIVSRRGDLGHSVAIFLIMLSLTGWAEIAVRAKVAVQGVRRLPFVEAAYTVGLTRWAVLWRHVLPNLRDVLLVEAAFAMAATMLLVAELAFLGVFVGAAERDAAGVFPIQAEWGGMLARGLRESGRGYWLLLSPMGAFTITILAFNLLAEGMRRRQ
jgi:ABC-type dipeptide/oligopeptide/nickel transport system permease subunit